MDARNSLNALNVMNERKICFLLASYFLLLGYKLHWYKTDKKKNNQMHVYRHILHICIQMPI